MNLFEVVDKFSKDNRLFDSENSIIVGLSGGADSIFLLQYFYNKLIKNEIKSLLAIHINHNLRDEAILDQQFCQKVCSDLDVKLHVFSEDVLDYSTKNGVSVEEAGREIRYSRFNEILAQNSNSLIATAHHIDDHVESVILNLVKGTGLLGLSGITVKGDKIIRPLLCLQKSEIERYLKNSNIEFIVDNSNFDTNYKRNFIRHNILPILADFEPSYRKKIFQMSQHSQNIHSWLEKNIALDCFSKDFWDIDYIPRSYLENNHSILYYKISNLLTVWGLNEHRVTLYQQISEMVKDGRTGYIDLSNNKTISLDTDGLRLVIDYKKVNIEINSDSSEGFFEVFNKKIKYKLFLKNNFNYILHVQYNDNIEYIALNESDFPIRVATKVDGLKTVNGKKIKELMIKNRLPKSLKNYWPLVINNRNLVIKVLFMKRWFYGKKESSKKI